jgi:hypothetical protein
MNQHSYMFIIIIVLICFSIFRRVRRNIGWQPFNQGSMLFRIALFSVIGIIFFTIEIGHPISLISDIVGIIIGCILAMYSISITTFEQREGHLFYRPNIWIGSIVTVMFLVRFIYRFYGIFTGGTVSGLQQGQTSGMQNIGDVLGNSWTTGFMMIMFAYYVSYNCFLLKKQKQKSKINMQK